jgi:NAD(P)-dependent dehydrogenase (short-subunit alcohol dehydrogenase family)
VLLKGKVAIVSGVGSGLGRSIALSFAREGAAVALGARTESMLRKVADEITNAGGRAWWSRLDVSDPASPPAFVDGVVDAFGQIDVLVNNGHHKGDFTPLVESNVDEWPAIMAVNLTGPMRLMQACVPHMRARGGGSIINVNSGAAVNSNPTLGAYSASKSALASVTRTLALEVGPEDIRVNGVYVSSMVGDNVFEWGATMAEQEGISLDEWFERKQRTEFALGRMPTPDAIAGVMVFVASDLACTVTGQNISANNGQWVVGPQ